MAYSICGVISLIIREEHGIQCMWCHLTYNSGGAWHTVYAMLPSIISERLLIIIQEEHGIQCMPCSSPSESDMQPEIH